MQLQTLRKILPSNLAKGFGAKKIGAFEARRRFGQLIEESFYHKDHFVVERSGRPMVAIIPIDSYQKWKQLAKGQIFEMLGQAWDRAQNQNAPNRELTQDVSKALTKLRRETTAKNK